ncbi:MAG TPA: polysaccharide deacetylase family protein [Terriglobales bacterium]|nr:polysaccharide deacetylase family protein [Terriglobales bacterium]
MPQLINGTILVMMVPLVSAAVAAGVVACGYQSMAPTGQWYGTTFTGLGRGSKKLALTYDDGPNDPHTLRLLDVLSKYQVRATFFMIGRYAEGRPDIVRQLVERGHAIGNHTYSHPNLIFCSSRETRREIEKCAHILEETAGIRAKLFRPPFGGRLPRTLRVLRALQLEPVMWNVTGWDWNVPRADEIERKVSARIRGGNIILLHDGGHRDFGADRSQTVIATERLIARYQNEGYEFVTVPEMMTAFNQQRSG